MGKRNADDLTIGKNGKAYYGKGTQGGLAPQPKTPKENIKEVSIESSKQIPNQTKTTGIGGVVSGENGGLDKYVAFNDAYSIRLDPYYFNENAIKQLQKVELKFQQFEKALKRIGYMDEQDPIITSKVQDNEYMIFFVGENELLEFSLATGIIEYDRKDVFGRSIWGRRMFPIGEHQVVISRLRTSLDSITKEITKQGFKIAKNHIKTLIQLAIAEHDVELVGDKEDLIPYVYAGIDQETIYTVFDSKNNPDYADTGKIAVSVETALKLNSIHTSFSKKILE